MEIKWEFWRMSWSTPAQNCVDGHSGRMGSGMRGFGGGYSVRGGEVWGSTSQRNFPLTFGFRVYPIPSSKLKII